MKKILILTAIASFTVASCSNQGAYSETEKKSQDSIDLQKQEADFESLLNDSNGKDTEQLNINQKPVIKESTTPSKDKK